MSIDIAKARALCAAATPGPWTHWPDDGDGTYSDTVQGNYDRPGGSPLLHIVVDKGAIEETDWPVVMTTGDAAFIASARTLLPEALDEIERLRKALADRAIMLPRCPDCGAYVGPQQP